MQLNGKGIVARILRDRPVGEQIWGGRFKKAVSPF